MKLFTGLFIFSCPIFLSAQQIPDSIPQGILRVQRPAIPASYKIKANYIYSESSKRNRSVKLSGNLFVFQDSIFDPAAPQPIKMFDNSGRLILGDSSLASELAYQLPEKPFDWGKYLELIHYDFAWSDTSRMDSAKYEFTIDKKGRASCKPLYWKDSDSTIIAFEKKSYSSMALLWQWYPARKIKNEKRITDGGELKYKKVACKVIVTIYAYDPNEGRLLPIESSILPK